jgi:hypothetical protein
MIAGLALPRTTAGQADAAWHGTWRLNLEKSTYDPGPPPYTRSQFTIQPHGDGLRVVYDMVRPRGGVTHLEWDGRFDGKDYPVQGVEEFITYAYLRIDARTYDVVTKIDGRVVATSRTTLSPDGRTITTTTGGRNAEGRDVRTVTVYEKVVGANTTGPAGAR